jgi:protein-arginine kinase activator protein McsA
MEFVTCNKCGWVHMGTSLEFAKKEIESFNKYYDTLTPEKQEFNYGSKRASLEKSWLKCNTCGNTYKNFRVSKDNDCPIGCTISPILHFSEDISEV